LPIVTAKAESAEIDRKARMPLTNSNSRGSSPARPVSESQSEMTELVLPNDTNTLGNLLGGRLMHFIDLVGAMAAYRHSRAHVVTASMEHIDFIAPVHVGDLIILKASVNRAFKTSMEVGVKVLVENAMAGTRCHVSSETADEQRRYEDAGRRRERRDEERARKKQRRAAREAQQTSAV
jgi:acyl-CoA hydrolase